MTDNRSQSGTKGESPATCFVIMPFSDTTHGAADRPVHIPAREWNHIYDNWILKAVQSYPHVKFSCKRSPAQPGNFIKGIVNDLAEAPLVVADLTGGRPNVYYELGIRHALKLGTIIITQDLKGLPSDLNGYYAFEYTYSDKASEYAESYHRFEKELHAKIEAFNKGEIISDSPVSDFLGFRAYLVDKRAYEEKQNLRRLASEFGRAMKEDFNTCELLYNAIAFGKQLDLQSWPVVNAYPMQELLLGLTFCQWHVVAEPIVGRVAELIREHRKLMLFVEQTWQVFRINGAEEAGECLIAVLRYVCEERKPDMEKTWVEVEKSLDELGLKLVHKTSDGQERTLSQRPIEKKDF